MDNYVRNICLDGAIPVQGDLRANPISTARSVLAMPILAGCSWPVVLPMIAKKAASTAGAVAALLSAVAYGTSAKMAKNLGAFSHYKKNKSSMLRVIKKPPPCRRRPGGF